MTVLNTLKAFQMAAMDMEHNSMQISKILSYIVPTNLLPATTSFLNNFCFPTFLQDRSKISLEIDLVKWLDLSQSNKFSHFQTFIDFGQKLPSFFSFKFPNFGSPHTGYCPPSNTGYCPQPNTAALSPIGSDSLSLMIQSPTSVVSETTQMFLANKNIKHLPLFVFSNSLKDKTYYKLLGMTDHQSHSETLLTQFLLHFLVYLEKHLKLFSGSQ